MFDQLPAAVYDFVRDVFADANARVTTTLATHPSMHEETLDHQLVMSVAASPPAFFARDNVAVEIQTHWLGGRRMYGRWEIADIGLFVILRQNGMLVGQKAALLQSKRLYSKEIAVEDLGEAEYRIGIGRLIDHREPQVPLTHQRAFSFTVDCVYGAMSAGSPQVDLIEKYQKDRNIPVYYTFYNPPKVPFKSIYPTTLGHTRWNSGPLGCRVMPAEYAHAALHHVVAGKPPTFSEMRVEQELDQDDQRSRHGWRLETFVADQLLRCKQGRRFDDAADSDLKAVLYERSSPIASAIVIKVDLEKEVRRPHPGERQLDL